MIDRRRLLAMGFGAGMGLGAPAAALAAAHRPGHHASGHGASGKARHGLQFAGNRHGRHGHGPELHHDRVYPEMEFVSLGPRSITLRNLHTDEKLDAVYWDKGAYVPDALEAVNKVLRDFRTGDVHPIDPKLLDLVTEVRGRLGSSQPIQVISGYRSPKTNAMLREQSEGVAQHSLHMEGMAIDLVLQDVDLDRLHKAALSLGRGGVGYYPARFVHLDVGPVRQWQGV
jgi:uncharacterized protein YcbK (DUF882 family)